MLASGHNSTNTNTSTPLASHMQGRAGAQPQDSSLSSVAAAAAVAGVALSPVLSPAELIKCRLQMGAAGRPSVGGTFTGPGECLRHLLRTEGPRGLTRGLSGTLAREAFGNALFFTVYEVRLAAQLRCFVGCHPPGILSRASEVATADRAGRHAGSGLDLPTSTCISVLLRSPCLTVTQTTSRSSLIMEAQVQTLDQVSLCCVLEIVPYFQAAAPMPQPVLY